MLEVEPVDERREVAGMCCGIRVYRQCRSLILIPGMDVRVLPSGHYNKGFVQSPEAITNNSSMGNRVEMSIMGRPLSVNDEFTAASLARIGLDPDRCVAFGTAAHMDNAAVRNTVSREGVRVSAAVTGGVRGNGGRAGDPASFDEAQREFGHKSGTIVIIVAIEARMTDAAMLEAMCTATQAKSCVLQELMARSLYSPRVATGSGTDQVGIAALSESETTIEAACIGTDVGDAVGRCVHDALAEALDLQSGMNSRTQCDPYVMLSRFGVHEMDVYNELRFPSTMSSLLEADAAIRRDPRIAAAVSAMLRVEDDVREGRADPEAGVAAVKAMADATLLSDVNVDSPSRVLMRGIVSIPEYTGFALALVLRERAEKSVEARA